MVIRLEDWVWTELAVEVWLHPILNRRRHGSPQTRPVSENLRSALRLRVMFREHEDTPDGHGAREDEEHGGPGRRL